MNAREPEQPVVGPMFARWLIWVKDNERRLREEQTREAAARLGERAERARERVRCSALLGDTGSEPCVARRERRGPVGAGGER